MNFFHGIRETVHFLYSSIKSDKRNTDSQIIGNDNESQENRNRTEKVGSVAHSILEQSESSKLAEQSRQSVAQEKSVESRSPSALDSAVNSAIPLTSSTTPLSSSTPLSLGQSDDALPMDLSSSTKVISRLNIAKLKDSDIPPVFQTMDSTNLIPILISRKGGIPTRPDFLAAGDPPILPILSKSEFVPNSLVMHLMMNKKPIAIAEKYKLGDAITNIGVALDPQCQPVSHAENDRATTAFVLQASEFLSRIGHNGVRIRRLRKPCLAIIIRTALIESEVQR